jgi:prevent-host-death family protein
MDELNADEARRNWRDMLDRVHGGEPIGITRNGKPWAVVVSREWFDFAQGVEDGHDDAEAKGIPLTDAMLATGGPEYAKGYRAGWAAALTATGK